MQKTFMKTKPVLPLVLSMSFPMIISMLVSSLYNIVDSYYVAQISENAMTALSLVFPIQNLINAVTIGFSIGANAVIAYHLGAQNYQKADAAATQSVIYNALHGVLLTIGCIVVMPFFLNFFTSDAQIIDMGIRYSRIAFSFAIVIAISMSMEKVYQAEGKMMITMVCMLSGCVANIILDPLFIFGWKFIPAMGIEGAAWATGIGQSLGLVIYIICYRFYHFQIHLTLKKDTFDKEITKKMYGVGIPAIFNLALPSLLISALNSILANFSDTYVLVLGVYYKLQTFLYLTTNGIVQGMRPIVGYNFGAKEYARVKKIVLVSLSLSIIIMSVGTLLCWLIPDKLIGLFSTNASTIASGSIALRYISIRFIISSVSVIISGALEGLGQGVPSLVISSLRYVFIIIPVAFVLSMIFGAEGVWHAFWITEFIAAAISYIIYKRMMLYPDEVN